jgi:Sec-independent protein secretion pathway component TatC
MPLVLLLAYVVACLLVGLLGRARRIGFSGVFVVSLFITPWVMALILLVSGQRRSNA